MGVLAQRHVPHILHLMFDRPVAAPPFLDLTCRRGGRWEARQGIRDRPAHLPRFDDLSFPFPAQHLLHAGPREIMEVSPKDGSIVTIQRTPVRLAASWHWWDDLPIEGPIEGIE